MNAPNGNDSFVSPFSGRVYSLGLTKVPTRKVDSRKTSFDPLSVSRNAPPLQKALRFPKNDDKVKRRQLMALCRAILKSGSERHKNEESFTQTSPADNINEEAAKFSSRKNFCQQTEPLNETKRLQCFYQERRTLLKSQVVAPHYNSVAPNSFATKISPPLKGDVKKHDEDLSFINNNLPSFANSISDDGRLYGLVNKQ